MSTEYVLGLVNTFFGVLNVYNGQPVVGVPGVVLGFVCFYLAIDRKGKKETPGEQKSN